MGDFKKLKVWLKAREIAVQVYKITGKSELSKDFRFRDQMRAAAISIASNIAEGEESGSNPNSIRYFNIAKGSCAELITQILIASDIGYIDKNEVDILEDKIEHIAKMLQNLIKARR